MLEKLHIRFGGDAVKITSLIVGGSAKVTKHKGGDAEIPKVAKSQTEAGETN